MNKHFLAAVVVLGVLIPSAAMADDKAHKGEYFPMPAAAFQQKLDARQAKMREHTEARIKQHNIPDAKAAEMRAHIAETQVKVQEAARVAEADGTVTREEARHVRDVAKAGHPAHQGHPGGRVHRG